jgi:hypothetical protein
MHEIGISVASIKILEHSASQFGKVVVFSAV